MTPQPRNEAELLASLTHEQRVEYWLRDIAKATGTLRTLAILVLVLAVLGVVITLGGGLSA